MRLALLDPQVSKVHRERQGPQAPLAPQDRQESQDQQGLLVDRPVPRVLPGLLVQRGPLVPQELRVCREPLVP